MYYFASDIHLGSGSKHSSRDVESRFVAWLDEVGKDAEAIFLLGDIFDFWFEYHRVVPKGFVRTLAKFAELTSRGVRIVFLTGNHDMWVYDYLTEECGVEVYTKPIFEVVAGKRLFLAHGDNMKINGQPLLRLMNAVFRSKIARVLFSWIVHPDLALKFGHWWSGKSRKSHGEYTPDGVNEPLVEYVSESLVGKGVDVAIFGHTHNAEQRVVQGICSIFLGEWESRPAYAVMDAEGSVSLKFLNE